MSVANGKESGCRLVGVKRIASCEFPSGLRYATGGIIGGGGVVSAVPAPVVDVKVKNSHNSRRGTNCNNRVRIRHSQSEVFGFHSSQFDAAHFNPVQLRPKISHLTCQVPRKRNA